MSIAAPAEKSSRSLRLGPQTATRGAKNPISHATRTDMQLSSCFYLPPRSCDSCGREGTTACVLAITSRAVSMTS
jgi:hypothetical protein